MINSKFTIVTFYQFKKIEDIFIFKNELSNFCKFNKIKGTIILAVRELTELLLENLIILANLNPAL